MTELPIVDLQGNEIGKITLRFDAVKILNITQVDLIMRYNYKTRDKVTAWLY